MLSHHEGDPVLRLIGQILVVIPFEARVIHMASLPDICMA
jgi:hypothetical protein